MKRFLILATILSLASIPAFADGSCRYKVLREGGDPSYGPTLKTRIQDALRVKTTSDYGYVLNDRTLEDCLARAREVFESHSDDINKHGRHEFPKIIVTYLGNEAEMKVVLTKKNSN